MKNKAALDAITGHALAAFRDGNATPPELAGAVLPLAAKIAESIRAQFPGQQETAARMLAAAAVQLGAAAAVMEERGVPGSLLAAAVINILGVAAAEVDDRRC